MLLALSCSDEINVAVSRQDQENAFKDLFGFPPPKSVTKIKYKDRWGRRGLESFWQRWIVFSYDEDVFSKILQTPGYKESRELDPDPRRSPEQPNWFPTFAPTNTLVYTRDNLASKQPGPKYADCLWHATNSHWVYLYRNYWD